MKNKILILALAIFSPMVSFAQAQGIKGLMLSIGRIVNILIPLAAALALLYFFYGLAKFILNSGDTDSHESGRQMMMWGIVALFVMVSIWGIVSYIQSDLGIYPVMFINAPGL